MTSTYLYGANVQANGIRQHYLRYGAPSQPSDVSTARQPLIIIPGITSPAITWGFVAERFGRHFDTYVLDVRGVASHPAAPNSITTPTPVPRTSRRSSTHWGWRT